MTEIVVISQDEYQDFCATLASKPLHQRTGQWFCNLYNIKDPSLFYETDDAKAFAKIEEKYLERG
jgi:hypothetical protein